MPPINCLAGICCGGAAVAGIWWLKKSTPKDIPRELKTRKELRQLLNGKRVLHVKGFGGGFGKGEHGASKQQEQDDDAVKAILNFRPDYLVVDGDPWGDGFQRYVKAYADKCRLTKVAVPKLVWVKDIKGDSPTSEERNKKLAKAAEWANQTELQAVVSWLPEAAISQGMNDLFGADCTEKLKEKKFDARGDVRLLGAAQQLEWIRVISGSDDQSQRDIHKAINDVESRANKQYFEKCSFENSAKGNAIYQHLRGEGCQPKTQGAVSFGGGESVLLEFATLYLFPGSGFDKEQAALLPFTRGRTNDPKLPRHVGSAFNQK